ncbi:ribonuclease H-like domain-containing protein, partial [Protomyces lactucae-debilis]
MGIEEAISVSLQGAIKAATLLGQNDLAFHTSLDTQFSNSLQDTHAQLLSLTSSILDYVSPGGFEALQEIKAVETRWGDLIDVVDHLLEQTDTALEETRQRKVKEAAEQEQLQAKQAQLPPLPASLRNAQDLTPPQRKFARKPDNDDAPWRPLITDKRHAMVPLLTDEERGSARQTERATHPYAHEIEHIEYPTHMFQRHEPIMYKDIDSQPLGWVSTQDTLDAMLNELRKATEIAVDLEHHDFHSFRGFVCLMQISTREQDWIVDTLALRDELAVLNEVFADSKIVKVLHGAAMDIIWLQRDFGLYIVNLFDSYHATKVLGFDGHGLAFLLKKYVDFDADKRYQLADWRIRPLPKEMLFYARCDTHFLLYVYDCLRNELLDRSTPGTHNMLASVLQASAQVSLREYSKEPYDAAQGQGADGWQLVLFKNYATRAFGPQQLETLKALHQWRDQVARELDESTRFVMSNNALVSLAAATPRDKKALQQCC